MMADAKNEYIITVYDEHENVFYTNIGEDKDELIQTCTQILADKDAIMGLKTRNQSDVVQIVVERKCPRCGRYERIITLTEYL
jgi:hypothetical protein